jgi:hypothetical protein
MQYISYVPHNPKMLSKAHNLYRTGIASTRYENHGSSVRLAGMMEVLVLVRVEDGAEVDVQKVSGQSTIESLRS